MPRRKKSIDLRLSMFVNVKVIGGAVAIAVFLTVFTLGLLWLTRPGPTPRGSSTAILSVIRLPATQVPSETQTPLPSPTGVPVIPPAPPPGTITVGAFVKIIGTSGEGLRLRSEPGFAGQVLLLGNEAEVFQVSDGPKDVDGYSWWYLTGSSNDKRRGWAVSNYLSLTQKP